MQSSNQNATSKIIISIDNIRKKLRHDSEYWPYIVEVGVEFVFSQTSSWQSGLSPAKLACQHNRCAIYQGFINSYGYITLSHIYYQWCKSEFLLQAIIILPHVRIGIQRIHQIKDIHHHPYLVSSVPNTNNITLALLLQTVHLECFNPLTYAIQGWRLLF